MAAAVVTVLPTEVTVKAKRTAVLVRDLATTETSGRSSSALMPRCVAIDPAGRVAVGGALGSDGGVVVRDPRTGAEAVRFRGHSLPILAIAFNPDGSRLAMASADRLVKPSAVGSTGGRELVNLSGHTRPVTAVAFRPDGRYLSTGTWIDVLHLATTGPSTDLRQPKEFKVCDAGK